MQLKIWDHSCAQIVSMITRYYKLILVLTDLDLLGESLKSRILLQVSELLFECNKEPEM